jgi:hypothetical protein
MKKSKIYNTIILLFCFITITNAQFEDVVKHWSFDENSRDKDHFSLFQTSGEVAFSSGIEGQSVSLMDKNYYVSFGRFLDLEEDFSVVFWFNVLETDGVQSLMLQSKTKENGDVNRYLHLAIADGKLLLKNEKTGLGLLGNTEIQSNFWYQLTYAYDGFETKMYLDNKLIFESTETSIFTKLPCCTDELFIGKPKNGAKGLNGYVDEIMIFEEMIEVEMITDINMIMNMKPPKIEFDTPKVHLSQPVVSPKETRNKLVKFTENRRNELQDSVFVKTRNIEIEIWDYDEFDKDKVRFVLNDKSFYTNILLDKKRKARKYTIPETINFKSNDDNYLIFYAEDMGKFSSQNTAAVRIWLDGKLQDKIYKLVLTEDKNAVLKITHSGEKVADKPIAETLIETPKTEIPMETPVEIEVNKIAKNKYELTVSDTVLMLKIMDNSVVDGDSVTILHNGKVVLLNYGLTSNLKQLPIQLLKNQANTFTFVPVSMGSKNTQNTALVIIEADGKVIDKVTLSSLNINRPAKLVIVQKMD